MSSVTKEDVLNEIYGDSEPKQEKPPYSLKVPFPGRGETRAIREEYRVIARSLCDKYGDKGLAGAKVWQDSILFVDNLVDEPKNKGKYKMANVIKMPDRYSQVLAKFTDHEFRFMLEVFRRNCVGLDAHKLIILLYHELKHILIDGGLRGHDVEDFEEIVDSIGPNWFHLEQLPDILAPGVNWANVVVPCLLPEPERQAEGSRVAQEFIEAEEEREQKAQDELMERRGYIPSPERGRRPRGEERHA